jgi:exportin-T
LDEQSLTHLKDVLLEYTRRIYGSANQDQIDPAALQNKLTQTLTFLFISMYKQGWETFLEDFLALTSTQNNGPRDNMVGIVLYLRILGSIHKKLSRNEAKYRTQRYSASTGRSKNCYLLARDLGTMDRSK